MRIVLFGDIHLFALKLWPWHLLSKRVLGQTNLWLNRRKRFKRELVRMMTQRIDELAPDFILSPGDLTTTATHAEFRRARHELADTFARFPAFVTAGNHDRYTYASARHRRFEQYFSEHTARQWPHHQHLGDNVELIALDSARPNRLFDRGRIGQSQRDALKRLLHEAPVDKQLIVLCHYTIGTPAGVHEPKRHTLIDEGELIDVLAGADRPMFYVHGHVHKPWCYRHPTAPRVMVINAGSPTHIDRHFPNGQGLWTIESADNQPAVMWHEMVEDHRWEARPIDLPTEPGDAVRIEVSGQAGA